MPQVLNFHIIAVIKSCMEIIKMFPDYNITSYKPLTNNVVISEVEALPYVWNKFVKMSFQFITESSVGY